MLFPENIYQKLGFDEVQRLLKTHCQSSMGKAMVDKMQFITKAELLQKLLSQTQEFKSILLRGHPFPNDNFYDIQSITNKFRVEGTWLQEDDLLKLLQALQTLQACVLFFKKSEGEYPQLEALAGNVQLDNDIVKAIEFVIDSKGHIKPSCSAELREVLASIHSTEIEIRKRLTSIFKSWQAEGYTSDGQMTVREGRMVIPVNAEYKRKAKGFIVDESSTGQTVFMEPTEVLELNNKLRDLEYAKRRVIVKILLELCDTLRPSIPTILQYHQFLSIIDFIRAKAQYAISIDAELVQISTNHRFDWIHARHALLLQSFKQQGKKVIPLSAQLNDEQRIIVISGPNAGGKSVALKTIGLSQVMFQHGLLVPMSADSSLGIFKKILVDIGDDQSLESDLSTYSAHLGHMRTFLQEANEHSLILIDEFGTGTDPKFGGPIAEAVLEALNQKKVRGVITTHYSNLKDCANSTKGLVNASMLYDVQELLPTYKLEIGHPGSSYAFEIAQKTGLPMKVIDAAKDKVGVQQQQVDELLIQLQREKITLEKLQKEQAQSQSNLKVLLRDNEQLKTHLAEEKKRLLRDAKAEAKRIISESNKLVERTIAEIRENKADKVATQELRKDFDKNAKELLAKLEEKEVVKSAAIVADLVVGDWVNLKGSEAKGRILSIKKQKAELAIGDLRTVANLQELIKLEKAPSEKNTSTTSYSSPLESYSPQLDLRGKRGDEALVEVDKFLDRSLMMGFDTIRILHGKGDGILRKLIREYLKKYSEVKSMQDEHVDFGGAGITVVELQG